MGNSVTYFLLCLLVFAGCDSRHDLATDPANSPVVVPFDLRYDEEQNAVVLEWEYLGIEPAVRYRFWRSERDGWRGFPWRDLPAPSREVNRRADVWEMMPIAHFDIQAGELHRYSLHTEGTAGKRPVRAPVGAVQIPGALLENIQFLPEEGTATVDWYLREGVPRRYELLRSVDDAAAQVIFQSEDPSVASFTDVIIEGNRKYTYRLRNTMDRDVVLESREMFIYPYQWRHNFNIVEAPNVFVALTSSTAFASSALALLATSDAISVREVNHTGYADSPRVLPVPNRAGLRLESLSVVAVSAGIRVLPTVLLGGILSETREVRFSAFRSSQLNIFEIPWQYEDWRVADSELPTAITIVHDGTIWVGVGQGLKAFSFNVNTIIERGSYDTGIEGAIRSLAALGSDIWMVTTQGEVFRTDTSHMGSQPVWEEVVLSPDVFPVWVGSSPKAVFVLARDRVVVFNADGQPVLQWRVRDDLVLDPAGLTVSHDGGVYVWDAQNRIVLFKNAPPFLVPFVQADSD